MSTYLGQPPGYKSADTDRQTENPPQNCTQDFQLTRLTHLCHLASRLSLKQMCQPQDWQNQNTVSGQNLALLWSLSITAKNQNIFPDISFCIFQLRGWHIFAMWHPDFLWNRCASLEIGTAKNPISGNMSVCSCFCRKINWSHKNFQGIGKEFDCFSKAFQRTW